MRGTYSRCSTQAQFETTFVDPHTGAHTFSFRLGEPVLYHPSHLAKPVFSRIESISNDHFTVACSTTDRMVPFGQAQKVLKIKLSLEDIERELNGSELDAAERLLWRRWMDAENMRNYRRSRVQAPCCGRYRYRFQLEHDGDCNWYCDHCWAAAPVYPPATGPVEPPNASVSEGDAAAGEKAVLLPRDNCDQPAKRRKQAYHGNVDFWNQYKCYGYAYFEGFSDRVLFHAKDCAGDMQPSAGDAVTAIVHRRRKGLVPK